jgi:hypothetical protein
VAAAGALAVFLLAFLNLARKPEIEGTKQIGDGEDVRNQPDAEQLSSSGASSLTHTDASDEQLGHAVAELEASAQQLSSSATSGAAKLDDHRGQGGSAVRLGNGTTKSEPAAAATVGAAAAAAS